MIGGMFILFLVLLLLNVPIAFSLGASSLFYLLTSNMNAAVLAQKFYAGIDSFTLLCIPGFMLAGALMNGGGITRRILNFCNAFLGHFTGSLALVNIVASMVFAGISGTAIADVCSLGGMLIPAMVEDGYDDDFSVAVTAASSVVGPIIPPSVPMVIAGSCVSISVGKMFQAGIIPGVLLGLALCVPTYIISVKRHYPKHERSSWKKRLEVTKDAIWALLMPVILLRVMDVNWLGTVMACQVFAVNMVGRDGCSIINITSMAAYDALSMVPAYASSKAAVDMFTKWLSNYLSNTAGKVRVNAVAPGYFLTPLNHDMYVNPDGSYTQRYWNVIHRTPMGRLGDPKELVGALRFFADPEMSGYITGQVIAVDGGFLSCPGI